MLGMVPFSSPYFRFAPALTGGGAGSGIGFFLRSPSSLTNSTTISPSSSFGWGLLDGSLS
jgi:hypothetical protein